MAENKLPQFSSLDKLVEFFETHDMGEYWENLPEVHFEVDIQRRSHLFALDEDVAEKVTAIAKAKQVTSKNLINEWLREKVLEQGRVG
jgi:hypothetical protein